MNADRRSLFGMLLAAVFTAIAKLVYPAKSVDYGDHRDEIEILRDQLVGERLKSQLLQIKYHLLCGKVPDGFRRVHRVIREGIAHDGRSVFTVYEEMD